VQMEGKLYAIYTGTLLLVVLPISFAHALYIPTVEEVHWASLDTGSSTGMRRDKMSSQMQTVECFELIVTFC